MTLKNLLEKLNLDESRIINIYHFGSSVYQTRNSNSDFDFIIVYEQDENVSQIFVDDIQATLYSENEFLNRLHKHKIEVLECIFLPDDFKLKESKDYSIGFILDLNILSTSLKATCHNSLINVGRNLIVVKII